MTEDQRDPLDWTCDRCGDLALPGSLLCLGCEDRDQGAAVRLSETSGTPYTQIPAEDAEDAPTVNVWRGRRNDEQRPDARSRGPATGG
jgi:hypothetical protein